MKLWNLTTTELFKFAEYKIIIMRREQWVTSVPRSSELAISATVQWKQSFKNDVSVCGGGSSRSDKLPPMLCLWGCCSAFLVKALRALLCQHSSEGQDRPSDDVNQCSIHWGCTGVKEGRIWHIFCSILPFPFPKLVCVTKEKWKHWKLHFFFNHFKPLNYRENGKYREYLL